MKYKLIAMDFDGTLLTDDKKVTKETERILRKLKEKGYLIVGVTARGLGSASAVVPLNMFNYLILNNGAYLYDIENEKGTYIGKINPETASLITNDMDHISKQVDYISGTTYYIHKKKSNANVDFIKNVESIEQVKEPLARMNIFLKDQKDILVLCKKLNEKYNDINCFIMQDSAEDKQWIVINPKGLNKKVTLENLGKSQNIALSEMIFFGDGLNDLEVIEAVGCGVAMGNALKEIKIRAKEITTTNNEDGVAEFLKKKL